MSLTDQSMQDAVHTLYIEDAGKDINGNKLFRLMEFASINPDDPTDNSVYVTHLALFNTLNDPFAANFRFRLEKCPGTLPQRTATDVGETALHYIGPI